MAPGPGSLRPAPARSSPPTSLAALNERSREIFRHVVESYLETGEPLGSRNLSRLLPMALSPASVRNVMADLEMAGLIYAPHASAGRLPTETGLRFFVDAMLQLGDLSEEERERIEAEVRAAGDGRPLAEVLAQASSMLSGLTRGAGLVLAGKQSKRLRHVEFVRLDAAQGLLVLVAEDGSVENRLVSLPPGLPAAAIAEASNYLNARIRGRTLAEAREAIEASQEAAKRELDALTARLVEAGLATWAGMEGGEPSLIVRGQANLLEDLKAAEDLERIRLLFADIEQQKDLIDLLGRAEQAEGVRIFIGSETKLFSLSGSAMVAAPFRDGEQKIVGVLGVIGPTRMNYGRIVPMVDYTARVVSKMLESRSLG